MRKLTQKIDKRRPRPLRLHQRRPDARHPAGAARLRHESAQRPPLDLPHRRARPDRPPLRRRLQTRRRRHPQPDAEPLLHSAKFAIADKDGSIREYYDSLEDNAVDHVARTVKDLAGE